MSEDRMREERADEVLATALSALPRERESTTLQEERTVRALRARGVLSGGRGVPRLWLAAAFAASVALFACGVVTGQWLNGRQAATLIAGERQGTLPEASQRVQETGTAYVTALARLAETNSVPGSLETVEARDAALQILHMAANEVVRLAPNDPVAVKILQGFDHAALQQAGEPRQRRRQIVWF